MIWLLRWHEHLPTKIKVQSMHWIRWTINSSITVCLMTRWISGMKTFRQHELMTSHFSGHGGFCNYVITATFQHCSLLVTININQAKYIMAIQTSMQRRENTLWSHHCLKKKRFFQTKAGVGAVRDRRCGRLSVHKLMLCQRNKNGASRVMTYSL